MTLIYRGLLVMLFLLISRCMFKEKDFWKQMTAAIVVIPVILRIIMIK